MSDEKQKPKAITTHDVEAPRPVVREHPPALTTNKIQPQLPTYPEEGKRRPAKGPMITTGNIEQFKTVKAGDVVYSDPEGRIVAVPATQASDAAVLQPKKGRAKKG